MAFYDATPDYEDIFKSIKSMQMSLDSSPFGSTSQFSSTKYIEKILRFEIDNLSRLISSQLSLSKYNYFDTILLLYQSKQSLYEWKQLALQEQQQHQQQPQQHNSNSGSNTTTTSGSSSGNNNISGSMIWSYQWLNLFLSLLVSKMTIYFYDILKQKEEELGGDIKSFNNLAVRTEINFYSSYKILYIVEK